MYPGDNQRLQRAIQIIIRARGSEIASEDSILIRRINNQRSLLVTVLPVLSPELLISTPQPVALLLVLDPERAPRPRTVLIQKALHLTQAEAALANILFEGTSLREAAEALGKSANTCKTQLKSIYAKTGCRSHVDLAKAMMTTAFGRAG